MSFIRSASIVGIGLVAMAFAPNASAVTIGFEDPQYVPGPLEGQQGWVSNSYNPALGGINGTVEVSTLQPLAGTQSLLYTQTGGTGSSDVSKAAVVSTPSEGTTAADLTGSVLLQADANTQGTGQLGLFLSPDAFNGLSPIGILLEGANSATAAGNILVLDGSFGDTGGFRNVGSYDPNRIAEFVYGVDFDNSTYDLAFRYMGDPSFTPLAGGGPNGSFTFFGTSPAFPAEADGTYSVDVGTFLRSGVGRIDNITLNPIPEPGTLGLALLGIGGLALRRRRRNV